MAKAYLGLGSNMGDKKNFIDEALRLLGKISSIKVTKLSSYYETAPVGYVDQDIFLNVAVEIETTLDPYELLAYCNEVEASLNRKRIIRWGPRTIDIDILLYENIEMKDEKLTIPHPRMTERAFVLIPLLEINQEIEVKGRKINEIMKDLQEAGIKKASIK